MRTLYIPASPAVVAFVAHMEANGASEWAEDCLDRIIDSAAYMVNTDTPYLQAEQVLIDDETEEIQTDSEDYRAVAVGLYADAAIAIGTDFLHKGLLNKEGECRVELISYDFNTFKLAVKEEVLAQEEGGLNECTARSICDC